MEKKTYKIIVIVKTGLHIGIGSDRPEIGGIDNPFIKDPISKLPYIPGSSLKGKLRSLLDTESQTYKITKNNNGNEVMHKDILRIFGGGDEPTRLIFRDLHLAEEHKTKYKSGEWQTEAKTEVKIDRKTGKAAGSGPRTTERIPPETKFEGDIFIRYETKDEFKTTLQILNEAIGLLNNDYLGGSGSRGYGAVEVKIDEG